MGGAAPAVKTPVFPGGTLSSPASNGLFLLRGRFNALHSSEAVPFLTAFYSATGFISSPLWSVIVRRFLKSPVYECQSSELLCPLCAFRGKSGVHDILGHHARSCPLGYGASARHTSLVSTFIRYDIRPACQASYREVSMLIPGSIARPADILVQSLVVAPGASPGKSLAVDVTVVLPFKRPGGSRQHADLASRYLGWAAQAPSERRWTLLHAAVRQGNAANTVHSMDWEFMPL